MGRIAWEARQGDGGCEREVQGERRKHGREGRTHAHAQVITHLLERSGWRRLCVCVQVIVHVDKIGLKDFDVYVDARISVTVVSGGKTMEPWQVERERERETARDTDRETGRQGDRKTGRQTDHGALAGRETGRDSERHRQRDRKTGRQTDHGALAGRDRERETARDTDRETGRQEDRQTTEPWQVETDGETERQTDRKTDRPTETEI